jgi:hypothetical protein
VPVVLLIAAVAILAGVVLAALGRVHVLAASPADFAPLELDGLTAADVALLRPPTALWGYNTAATDEALQLIAQSVTERDVEIARLRRQLAELQGSQPPPPAAGPASYGPVLPPWPAEPAPGADG